MGAALYCCRCDKAILRGHEYQQVDKFSANGAGAILHEHLRCVAPARVLPVRRRGRRTRSI